MATNELRQDPITGRWVIIAPHRDVRPNQFRAESAGRPDDGATTCPFCAHQMDTPPIVARYAGEHAPQAWQVCVVPNRYPILTPRPGSELDRATGLFSAQPAWGLHEVVIESPTHVTRTAQLSAEQFILMLKAYRDRMRAMRDQDEIVYGQIMKNWGHEAGASLQHAHSQVFGMPFVPEQAEQELVGTRRYFEQHRECVLCKLITAELRLGERIVATSEHFAAWCPHASRFGFETCIAPRNHQARFEELTDSSLEDLGDLFQSVLRRIEQHPRITAYNYLVHSLPFDSSRHDHYHWHIEILPRIAKQAGFEWGTRVHVNTVAPEHAAAELREDGRVCRS